MRAAYDVATVRAAEARMMAAVPEGELMQRAATGLARTCAGLLAAERGGVYGASVCLLVGAGNNGGDALFAGSRLQRRGAQVTAVLLSEQAHPPGLLALRRAGGHVLPSADARAVSCVEAADVVVDGIVGIGGRGGLRPRAAELAEVATDGGGLVVAVDLPSGVDADTGAVPGEAVWADVTVTFGTLKPGLAVTPGVLRAGLLEVVDIGLDPYLPPPVTELLELEDVARLVPRPHPLDHKYSQGVVGVAAGSSAFPGAAVLTVGGALHTRPGLVRYAGPVAADVVRAWPSVVVGTGPPSQAGRAQAWSVGPGIGVDDAARALVDDVLGLPVPVVLDADALTVLPRILAGAPDRLRTRGAAAVLTPHEGEFARLAPDLDLAADRLGGARRLAERTGATVLLKGFSSVVAAPDGRTRVNPTGTRWLATGGTGDVLTGVLGSYLAAGLDPLDAASVAAFVHGLAGRLAAADGPPTSADVVSALPGAFLALG
jgi:hydroxyethylthiazole kinase-like uncharacterized protein yjeF